MWHVSLLQACPSLQAWSPGEGSWPQSTLHLWPCWRERVPSRWVSPTQASSACGMNRTTTSMASPTTRMTWRGYREEAQVSSRCWDKVEFFFIYFFASVFVARSRPGFNHITEALAVVLLFIFTFPCFQVWLNAILCGKCSMMSCMQSCTKSKNLVMSLSVFVCEDYTKPLWAAFFYFFKAILSVKSATKPSLVELLYFYNSNAAYFIHLMNKYILCCHFFPQKQKCSYLQVNVLCWLCEDFYWQ